MFLFSAQLQKMSEIKKTLQNCIFVSLYKCIFRYVSPTLVGNLENKEHVPCEKLAKKAEKSDEKSVEKLVEKLIEKLAEEAT